MDLILKQQLIRDEGLQLKAYQDTVGLWTIGVGHLLGKTPRMTEITKAEAFALLAYDVETAEILVEDLIPDAVDGRLNAARSRVLINMAFNLGGRLRQFKKFLAALEVAAASNSPGDWKAAADEMRRSKWAQQVGNRAERLAKAMETGVDQ